MFALSVNIFEKFGIEICMTLTLKGSMSNINMQNRKLLCDFLFVSNSNICLTITICEILTVEMCMTLTMTLRMGQGQM